MHPNLITTRRVDDPYRIVGVRTIARGEDEVLQAARELLGREPRKQQRAAVMGVKRSNRFASMGMQDSTCGPGGGGMPNIPTLQGCQNQWCHVAAGDDVSLATAVAGTITIAITNYNYFYAIKLRAGGHETATPETDKTAAFRMTSINLLGQNVLATVEIRGQAFSDNSPMVLTQIGVQNTNTDITIGVTNGDPTDTNQFWVVLQGYGSK